MVKNNEFHMFDLGGQWITSQQHALLDLMQKLDITTESRDNQGNIIMVFNGKQYKQNKNSPYSFCSLAAQLELASFVRKFEILCRKTTISRQLAFETMQEFIEENLSHESNRAILSSLVLINCGLSAEDISVGFYVFFCISTHGITNQLMVRGGGLREMWVQDGAQEICMKMAVLLHRDVEIKKNTSVLDITIYPDDVAVGTSEGTLFSKKVVLAVPPSQLSRIAIAPPVPKRKLAAFGSTLSGTLTKFVATYEEAFWKNKGYSGDIYVLNGRSPTQPLLCCFDTTVEDKPALTGYMIKHEGQAKFVILEQLARYFGRKALQPLYCGARTWKQGSPMCLYQSFQDVLQVQQKFDGVYWAGAETSIEWYGSMCGAVMSGYRVANDLLYDIHPSILSISDMELYRSDLSSVQERNLTHNDVYKHVMNPYYQISAALLLTILAIIVWRKAGVTAYLKNLLTKK